MIKRTAMGKRLWFFLHNSLLGMPREVLTSLGSLITSDFNENRNVDCMDHQHFSLTKPQHIM